MSLITTLENRFSQSELVTHASCVRKWYYSYVALLKPKTLNWAFVVGNEVHRFMEQLYRGEESPMEFNPTFDDGVLRDDKFERNFEFWSIVFPTLMEQYFLRVYLPDKNKLIIQDVESVIEKEYRGLIFQGKKDIGGCIGNNQFMMDHKTTSRIDTMPEKLDQRFQFLFYFWLSGLGNGKFIVNQIKKPALRLKVGESNIEFAIRCKEDIIAKPAGYFGRLEVNYSAEQIHHFERNVLDPKIDRIHAIIGAEGDPDLSFLWREMNLDNCYNYNSPCPFLPMCFPESGLSDDEMDENLIGIYYDRKTSKHEELEIETSD